MISSIPLRVCATDIIKDTLTLCNPIIKSPSGLIEGQVSGVFASATDGGLNSQYNTAIRGVNSLRGEGEPLWIVDGVVINNSLRQNQDAFWQDSYQKMAYTTGVNQISFIAPYDIESIEVLKDVSATSIFGSRGANGVIIIKTKKAKSEKFSLDWHSNIGVNTGAGFSHNHTLQGGSSSKGNTYSASAFFRSDMGSVARDKSSEGGLNLKFESIANKIFHFGLNANIAAAHFNNASSVNWYRASSAMIDRRAGKDISGWNNDYDDETVTYRAIAHANLDINLAKFLVWKSELGVSYVSNSRYIWYGKGTPLGSLKNGAAAILGSSMLNFNVNSRLIFNFFTKDDHHIGACLGFEYMHDENIFNNMNGADFFSHELRARGLQLTSEKAVICKFNNRYNNKGFYGNLIYDFKGIFGATGTFRADNFSRYDGPSFTIYPSITAFVDLKKAFLCGTNIISTFKLDGGYGIAGRGIGTPMEMTNIYATGIKLKISEDAAPAFEGLNRITSKEWNVGINFGFASDKVIFSARYFDKNTVDAFNIYQFAVPYGDAGNWKISERTKAYAFTSDIRNRGFEFDLNTNIFNTQDYAWSITANATILSNQLTKVSDEDMFGRDLSEGFNANINAVGRAVSALYGYDTDAEGNRIDHTGDGIIAPEDRICLGNTIHPFYAGFGTSARISMFTVELFFDGAAGGNILNMNRMFADNAEYITKAYVERGDYLRFKKFSLSYSVPVSKIKWLHNLSINFVMNNVFTATNYSGYNPDVDCFGTSGFSRGIDYGSFPMIRTFMLGVSAKF